MPLGAVRVEPDLISTSSRTEQDVGQDVVLRELRVEPDDPAGRDDQGPGLGVDLGVTNQILVPCPAIGRLAGGLSR